jgi:hypothetical protein
MSVPETSVYKNSFMKARKYNIRRPRKILAMEPKAEAHAVGHAAHCQFRRSVFAFHRLHRSPSNLRRLHQAL